MLIDKVGHLFKTSSKFHDNTIWPFGGAFLGYKLKDIPDDYLISLKQKYEGKKLNSSYRFLITYLKRRYYIQKVKIAWNKGLIWINDGLNHKFSDSIPEGFKKGAILPAHQIPTKEQSIKLGNTRRKLGYKPPPKPDHIKVINPRPDNYIKERHLYKYEIIYNDYFDWLNQCELCGDTKCEIYNINWGFRTFRINFRRKTNYTASDLMKLCNDCSTIFLAKYQNPGVRLSLWIAHIMYMDAFKPLTTKSLINHQLLKSLL